MPPKPPYYKQETPYSCAPACLRMVMEAAGVVITEQEIRQVCGCDIDEEGVEPDKLKAAAREFGFGRTSSSRIGSDEQVGLFELKKALADGCYPIVYLKMTPPIDLHAVVVISVTEERVLIHDPLFGEERSVTMQTFMTEWTGNGQRIILVE